MKLDLTLHAQDLKNVAGLKGTSDPFAVVTNVATAKGSSPEVIGKTEVIPNTLNPHWTKSFVIDYELGTPLRLVVNVLDEIEKGENKSMGACIFEVGALLGTKGGRKGKRLQNGATIYAQVRKSTGNQLFRFKLRGIDLKNTEGLGFGLRKSDPFFELCRWVDGKGGETWDRVCRSNVVRDHLSPHWRDSTVGMSALCSGNMDHPLMLNVYDHERDGKHEFMGGFKCTVQELLDAAANQTELQMIKKGKKTGKVMVVNAQVVGEDQAAEEEPAEAEQQQQQQQEPKQEPAKGPPTFVDYIAGGCELNVVVAIDFTGSNGDPRKEGTLHYFHPDGQKNDYEKAMSAILTILSHFDSDKKYPVLGFGAKYDGEVNHCFQCGPEPEVEGVDGVLDAYKGVFKSGFIMSKPTVFTEVIETAAARATSQLEAAIENGRQAYTILLILSDGAVSDTEATAAMLEQVSDTPLSIVIVGVGEADFSSMEFLDDFASSGRRDIAQFVEFNKHSDSSVSLTSVTLKEIPKQLVSYFQGKDIQPLPPIETTEDNTIVEEAEAEVDLTLEVGEDGIVISGGGEFHDAFD